VRPYGIYYGDKEGGSEVEDIIEVNEDVVDENSSEIDEYYIDKIGKYYRNCNLIFELGNKFY
jgi:hypothetical protein